MKTLKNLLLAAVSACTLLLGAPAHAQGKVTRIVVPYPAGGTSDFLARSFAERFQVYLGAPVIIDNRPGANGAVGAQQVARSAPDGSTLLLCGPSVIVINPHVLSNIGNPMTDLVPVSRLTVAGSAMFVPASHPATNIKEYIAWAKARNKPVTFGSSGAGGVTHLWIELFGSATGLKTLHVPYKGVALAATDVIGGEIDAEFSDIAPLMPLVKAGRLKMLGLIGPTRNPALPDLPTFAEQGVQDMLGVSWYGLLAPARTPPDVVKRISEAARKAMEETALQAQLASGIMVPAYLDPEAFSRIERTDFDWWGKVVRRYNIRAE